MALEQNPTEGKSKSGSSHQDPSTSSERSGSAVSSAESWPEKQRKSQMTLMETEVMSLYVFTVALKLMSTGIQSIAPCYQARKRQTIVFFIGIPAPMISTLPLIAALPGTPKKDLLTYV